MLGITSWWPHTWVADKVRADQRKRKQARDRDADTARRRSAGAITRAEYLAGFKRSANAKPWEAAGVSRRAWFRHRGTGNGTTSLAPIRESSYRDEQPSAKPWQALGKSRRTWFRRKAAGTLPRPMPTAIIGANALDLDTFDFAEFGIIAIRVMRGTDVVRAWVTP